MAKLNKKILCFVDETGTAGDVSFALGLVYVFVKDAAKVDKAFSDLLPAGFGEFHANKLGFDFFQRTLGGFAANSNSSQCRMYNYRSPSAIPGCRQSIYAQTLINAVKSTAKSFREDMLSGSNIINNIELIVDANSQNLGNTFSREVEDAIGQDGVFRGVERVIQFDSSGARLLQLADAVAYSRRLLDRGHLKTKSLSEEYRIKVI